MANLTFQDHLGFLLKSTEIQNHIFIPKYYNPEIWKRLKILSRTHDLVPISDLIEADHVSLETGHEIGKMAYGTGNIPFIRTSDISNWEIKTDPKQGVSQDIYNQFADRQDIQEGDIFFVRDGTYLIGQCCIITTSDLPCLYQSHILKIRVNEGSPISRELFFACLNAPILRQQIRCKQFTADIIDTIGNRFSELILPVPKSQKSAERLVAQVQGIIKKRSELREEIRRIPLWAQGLINGRRKNIPPDLYRLSESTGNPGFIIRLSEITSGIFMPKFYDPVLEAELKNLSVTHDLVSLGDLVASDILVWETGIEVGKMAYGTGEIPFIRTSDFSNWELKIDPKQNVSEDIYNANKQDVKVGDILVMLYLTPQDHDIFKCNVLRGNRNHAGDDRGGEARNGLAVA